MSAPGIYSSSLKSRSVPHQSGDGAQPKDSSNFPLKEAFWAKEKGTAGASDATAAAAADGGPRAEAESTLTMAVRVCDVCGKVFSSQDFLQKHIKRRHPGEALPNPLPADASKDTRTPTPPPSPPPLARVAPNVSMTITASGNDAPVVSKSPKHGRKGILTDNAKGLGREGNDSDDGRVEEGARRLGELVREREQARVRSEVEALRKEINELKKVCA